ncbi:uncharacterized protein LOC142349098 [Convolutriloba macropyga]|uniref:uncharacterized protein LOC142349098 n=1 Tax=Convolutriloba macropyga TaxID=536237 RepID=UPI003F5282DA
MALNGEKIFLVAKIKQQIYHLNNAIVDKNCNLDWKGFKTGINADLEELEQCIKREVDNAGSQNEAEELTKEFLEVREKAEAAMETHQGTVCTGKLKALLSKSIPTKDSIRSILTCLIFNWSTAARFGAILLSVAVLVIRRIFLYQIWWAWSYYEDDYIYGDTTLRSTDLLVLDKTCTRLKSERSDMIKDFNQQ